MTELATTIDSLRAQVEQLEGGRRREQLATHRFFEGLLTLQTGGVYTVESRTLAMLLMAGPSSAGAWSAVVGVPEFGVEAATEFGVDPARVVMVPHLEHDTVSAIGALVDVVDVLVLAPIRVAPRDGARLTARLRERGCVLITWGDWGADVLRVNAHVGWSSVRWHGIGAGHGHLQSCSATLEVRVRDRLVGTRPVRSLR